MQGHLLLTNCLTDEVTRETIELALKENRLLWLDLDDTGDEVLDLLRDVFKFHPLAVEDAKEFNQRPKIEDYDDFVSIVAYGARELGEPLTEVHSFFAENFLVSVHRDPIPAIGDACRTLTRLRTDRRLIALYRLLDAWSTACSRTWPRSMTASTRSRTRSSRSRKRSSWPSCSR